MAEILAKFNVFIMEEADINDAVEFCTKLGIENSDIYTYADLKIDDVRRIKNLSRIASEKKHAFVFGRIGLDAQNALLKLLEEPYLSVYFVLYKSGGLLDTIRSRAQTIKNSTNYEADKEILDAVVHENIQDMLVQAQKLQYFSRDDIVMLFENISRQLSLSLDFKKSDIINNELRKLKQFNLNRKLFVFALFSKLFGGVK